MENCELHKGTKTDTKGSKPGTVNEIVEIISHPETEDDDATIHTDLGDPILSSNESNF